jgi:hypothetical protein
MRRRPRAGAVAPAARLGVSCFRSPLPEPGPVSPDQAFSADPCRFGFAVAARAGVVGSSARNGAFAQQDFGAAPLGPRNGMCGQQYEWASAEEAEP